ncbi:hypothetical protein [Richelia sinica]|nr:hypothetical protein [Richelia sinica]
MSNFDMAFFRLVLDIILVVPFDFAQGTHSGKTFSPPSAPPSRPV